MKAPGQVTNAGNIADLFKHSCLISFFQSVSQTNTSPLTYMESHSGFVSYPLNLLRCKRVDRWSGERQWSLPTFLSKEDWNNLGCSLLKETIAKGFYPGSPYFAMTLFPSSSRLIFCDLDPGAIDSIGREAGQKPGVTISALQRDGFSFVLGKLQDARVDSAQRKQMVFLDPWYKDRQYDEDKSLEIASMVCGSNNTTLLAWYKRYNQPDPHFYGRLKERDIDFAEIWFPDAINWKHGPWCSRNTPGGGIFWINAPEMIEIAERIGSEMVQAYSARMYNQRRLDLEFRAVVN